MRVSVNKKETLLAVEVVYRPHFQITMTYFLVGSKENQLVIYQKELLSQAALLQKNIT